CPGIRSAFSPSVTITLGWESLIRCSIPSLPKRTERESRIAPDLPGSEECRGGFRRGGRADRDPVAALDPARGEQVGGAVGEGVLLSPAHLPLVAAEVLEDHRRAIAGLAGAGLGGDVVALGHPPGMPFT